MKNHSPFSAFLLMLVLTFSFSQQLHAQCPNIQWADEFSGNSLDESKWNYQIGDGCNINLCGWGNNELQSYQQENVVVSNGTLQITAMKKRLRGSAYTSGRINTKGKAEFTYGRFEASIKLPAGDGLWPAFWMLPTDEVYGIWPQSGEIDIMEFTASQPDEIYGTIHYGDPYPGNQYQGNDIHLASGTFPEAFHEFAIEWEPGVIRWFLDGYLYSTKTTADIDPFNWPFDQNFHFLLNVAVGGTLGGPVDESALPSVMEVDYVRVYDGFRPYLAGERLVPYQGQQQAYSIGNIGNNTNITWSVPAGATIASGQGSSDVLINFGDSGGLVTATFDAGCGAETLSVFVDVEPPYIQTFAFENFDDSPTAIFSFSTGNLSTVANPAANAVNSSALCGSYTRNSAEQYDLIVYDVNNISDAGAYVSANKKFSIDVYTDAPVGTDVLLQLETAVASSTNYPSGRHSRYVATTTKQQEWERLTFSLLDQPDPGAGDGNVTSMLLLFASNSFTGDVYYYDNLDNYEVDNGGSGSNNPPTVSITAPADGSSFPQGTVVTVSADASDSDGSVSEVEFFANGVSIGTDITAPYSVSWSVPLGNTTLTAVATDNEADTTTSNAVSVSGTATGDATSVHVSSITTGTASAAQGKKRGTATVTIVNDLGVPVSNAVVSGTFSGTFAETASGTTDGNGTVTVQTVGTKKGSLTINFCVDDVTASLPYDAGLNAVTCAGEGARIAGRQDNTGTDNVVAKEVLAVRVFPNPVDQFMQVQATGFNGNTLFRIYDINGNILQTGQLAAPQSRLDVSALQRGIFLLQITDHQNNHQTVRFVK